MICEEEILSIIEKRERRKVLSHLQLLAERDGHIPHMPSLLLERMAWPLQFSGAVLLGIILGLVTVFVAFIIIVRILHLGL
ncbi:MAG TPA: hypothetical protein VFF47_02415 [Nitrospirota bacterium]|nr:hypothetical protein [Nitrospirota bacterium]